MKFSFNCPACKKKLGIMCLLLSITPFLVRCYKCSSSIKIKNIFLYIFLNTIASGIMMLIYIAMSYDKYKTINVYYLITIYMIFNYISLLIVSNKGSFITHKNRHKKKNSNIPYVNGN